MVESPGAVPVEPARRPSLAASALLTYGTNVLVAILSLGNVLVVARSLGPHGRGDVAFLTTVSFLVANLAMVGVQEANANLGGRSAELRPRLATNSALLALGLGAAAAAIVAALVVAVPAVGADEGRGVFLLALMAIPVLVYQGFLDYLVRSEYAFVFTNAAWLCAPITNVTVNGTLALAGVLSVASAFATWVAGWTLSAALLSWYVARRSSGFGRPDRALARRSLSFGVKTHTGRVMTLGNYRLDQWLLGAISGSRELGLYSVAVAWAEVLFFLPTVLVLVQRPDLVRASRPEAVRQAALAFRVTVLFTAVLAAVMIVAAPFLCATVFGADFRGSIDELRILVPGAFGMVALKLFTNVLTAQDRPLRGAVGMAVAFVATVALDVALIPSHGADGAALASTLAYTLGGVAIAALFARSLGGRLSELVPRGTELAWFWRKVRAAIG